MCRNKQIRKYTTLDMNSLLIIQNRAIKAAQEERWDDAVSLNKQVLKIDDKNTSALNRLGFAYMQSGDHEKAQKTYNTVLKIDRTNSVAKKYLALVEKAKQKKPVKLPKALKHSDFIDEPGKTKSVTLVRLPEIDVIEDLSVGAECVLHFTKTRISVKCDGIYIGTLPDDICARLLPLLEAGNEYTAKVQSLKNGTVRIFLREVSRAESMAHMVSFPSESTMTALSLDNAEVAREDEEPVIVSETGEGDEDTALENRDIDEVLGENNDDYDDDEDIIPDDDEPEIE